MQHLQATYSFNQNCFSTFSQIAKFSKLSCWSMYPEGKFHMLTCPFFGFAMALIKGMQFAMPRCYIYQTTNNAERLNKYH